MIRVFAVRAVVLSIAFVLLIGAAIFVGVQQQPPSQWAQLLHLNDCELPCWIGIEPGKTTFADAAQRITDAYQDASEYQVPSSDTSNQFEIVHKASGNRISVDWESSDGQAFPQSIVQTLNIIPECCSDAGELSLADVYVHLGKPEAVQFDSSFGLYFEHQQVVVLVYTFDCYIDLPQTVTEIVLSASPSPLFTPSGWRGFGQCYN